MSNDIGPGVALVCTADDIDIRADKVGSSKRWQQQRTVENALPDKAGSEQANRACLFGGEGAATKQMKNPLRSFPKGIMCSEVCCNVCITDNMDILMLSKTWT
jgi:hypothetical protein